MWRLLTVAATIVAAAPVTLPPLYASGNPDYLTFLAGLDADRDEDLSRIPCASGAEAG